jgi:2-keto-4-pentenoate hydratase/2-oxohepta-3-ene-1,7-dioic acid hydratase in catechol pathway
MKNIAFLDGGRQVPVGKILCLGRNYPEHAREMKAQLPSTPVVFLKPPSALIDDGGRIVFPPYSQEMHHEVELVALIGVGGSAIPRERAMDHIGGYAVGLDMTLRDLQSDAKKAGLPWTVAKGFDTSAPVSRFVPRSAVADPSGLDMSLSVNDVVKQSSNTRHMLFSIPDIVAYLSIVFTLEAGDLIFTGTPEGVGPVKRGDTLHARISSVGSLTVGVQ